MFLPLLTKLLCVPVGTPCCVAALKLRVLFVTPTLRVPVGPPCCVAALKLRVLLVTPPCAAALLKRPGREVAVTWGCP